MLEQRICCWSREADVGGIISYWSKESVVGVEKQMLEWKISCWSEELVSGAEKQKLEQIISY